MPKRAFLSLALALSFFSLSPASGAIPKAGTLCSKVGLIKIYQGKTYTCIKSGKKIIWNKGQIVISSQTSQSPSPTPYPSTSQTPTLQPSPSTTPNKSISERWGLLNSKAIEVFNIGSNRNLPSKHSMNFDWVPSANVDSRVVEEVKKRYDFAARYWSSYSRVKNTIKVLIGNYNEVNWICSQKLAWLQMTQPDCIEIESNGQANIPTAGQSQKDNRNVDMYQIKSVAEMENRFFIGRIEHEFTHNIFYEQSSQYQEFMPCWQIEGGAEFFGILIASNDDLDRFIQTRNAALDSSYLNRGVENWSTSEWIKFLNETDRTDIANRQGDTCGPVRNLIYHHVVLANEYLVLKLGIQGYLNLIKVASNSSWDAAIRSTFGMSKQSFYSEIAQYMQNEYRIMYQNKWSYDAIQRIPFGR